MVRQLATGFLATVLAASFSPSARAGVLADSGFRPKPNGFSFENWGGKQYPYSRLTADDSYFLFGDQACARIKDDSCVPTPGARLWIDEMNRSTEGGHCEGMAVLSASLYSKFDSVADYGARSAFELKPDNRELMRSISTYFTTQALEPVQSASSASRAWPLQKIVDSLVTSLKSGKDLPTLGIYFGDGGHAVTPYSVESRGERLYRVNIYDNNYPGVERYIDIDVAADRWVYAGGALNPSEDPAPWQGSSGSMDITPLSVRYEPLKCPFCAAPSAKKPKAPPAAKPKPKSPSARPGTPRKPGAVAENYSVVTPNRCSQVQAIGKKDKKQIRMQASKVDNQITGASMRPLRGSRGCAVSLPRGEEYDVRLVYDGRPSARPGSSLSVFGLGKAWSVDNVILRPGATEIFSVSARKFTYTAGSKQRPTLRVADDTGSRNGYYEVSGFEINEGFEFAADEDANGRTTFSDNDPSIDTFDIKAEVVGDEETRSYDFNDVSVGDDGQALLDINDEGELEMDVDSDSDGQADDVDSDDDNDGIPDTEDADDDNDGTADSAADHAADDSSDADADDATDSANTDDQAESHDEDADAEDTPTDNNDESDSEDSNTDEGDSTDAEATDDAGDESDDATEQADDAEDDSSDDGADDSADETDDSGDDSGDVEDNSSADESSDTDDGGYSDEG